MTRRNRSPKNLLVETDESLEQQIYDALRINGWILPMTENDVRRAEETFDEDKVSLPDCLRVPPTTSERKEMPIRPNCWKFSSTDETVESLARAAREGGSIRSEVEERMRSDREEAERTEHAKKKS